MPILQVKEECVGDYLEEGREEDLVEEKVLEKRSLVLDIVTEASSHSCCFTAGYTRCSIPGSPGGSYRPTNINIGRLQQKSFFCDTEFFCFYEPIAKEVFLPRLNLIVPQVQRGHGVGGAPAGGQGGGVRQGRRAPGGGEGGRGGAGAVQPMAFPGT